MKNRVIFAAVLFMGLITIREAEAGCPETINRDQLDSLQKGNKILGTDNEYYVLTLLLPKTATLKHNEKVNKIYQGAEPAYCFYYGGNITNLSLSRK